MTAPVAVPLFTHASLQQPFLFKVPQFNVSAPIVLKKDTNSHVKAKPLRVPMRKTWIKAVAKESKALGSHFISANQIQVRRSRRIEAIYAARRPDYRDLLTN